MNSAYDKYEIVIGLEVHTQLATKSKVYSSDKNEYGAPPNSNVSPISLGHPGTLPRLNIKAIEYGVKLGVALQCNISHKNHFDRKNYFYADLPKGYQITQDATPICKGGFLKIKDAEGNEKQINLSRIHIEEDAGKSIHDIDPLDTLIDLNRAGTPLLEIVTEPELNSSTEAYNFLYEIRKIVRYLEICDGNMEEGSMRCDANISVRLKGAIELGTRTEIKNMNSLRNVQRAIDLEAKRQIDLIENGGCIVQETRSYIAATNDTVSMRAKEAANDYRYFPEPDLQPFYVEQSYIDKIRKTQPPLPAQLFEKYITTFGLSTYDAEVLTDTKEIALYFEELSTHTSNYKSAANWIMGPIKSFLNENSIPILKLSVTPRRIAELITLIDDGRVSNSTAMQNIFPQMCLTEQSALEIATINKWLQESNEDSLTEIILMVFQEHPEEVERYRNGAKNLLGLFMGKVMKKSGGSADPKKANILVRSMLEN